MMLDIFLTINVQTFSVFLAVFLIAYKYVSNRNNALPPGPLSFPVVGSLPYLMKGHPGKALLSMKAKYGDVFTIYMGSDRNIVLASLDAIKEAFVGNANIFAARPQNTIFAKEVVQGGGMFLLFKCLMGGSNVHFLNS